MVGNVYNALCCDLISSNRSVVLISKFFVPQARTDGSVRAYRSAAVMNEASGHIPGYGLMVGYSLRAGQNSFTGWTQPASRMLPMPALTDTRRKIIKITAAKHKNAVGPSREANINLHSNLNAMLFQFADYLVSSR